MTGPPSFERGRHGFHVHDARDAVRVAARPVEPEARPPVVQHQRDRRRAVVREPDRLEPRIQVRGVLVERVRAADGQAPAFAHADQVGREAAPERRHVRDHVAPQVRAGRVPVQKHDRGVRIMPVIGRLGVRHFRLQDPRRLHGGPIHGGGHRRKPPPPPPKDRPRGARDHTHGRAEVRYHHAVIGKMVDEDFGRSAASLDLAAFR